jgi:hypothetical protein
MYRYGGLPGRVLGVGFALKWETVRQYKYRVRSSETNGRETISYNRLLRLVIIRRW